MFSLVSGFWKWLTSKNELRFLIIGLDNAGKTTTLEQLKRIYSSPTKKQNLERVTPTIGLNLCHTHFDYSTSGVFWDLGGQLILRDIWEKHYSECDGVLFVIDSTDEDRFAEVKSTLDKILNHSVLRQRDIPIVILINKQDDTEHAVSLSFLIGYLGLKSLVTDAVEPEDQGDVVLIPYPADSNRQSHVPSAEDPIASLSHILSRDSAGPVLVCISGCSATKNVNIKESIDCLVKEAKEFAEKRRQ
ncbi:ADP-ribosylation factor-related protein 1-like [Condylostylus longicornis]|uniref:ADP-ribosylation factor-related protein 1-like n=1 Tax=Condylostylus longicornis TaxID=2530218 RepID=UPI00244DB076|nr:ADP-ribosylation factor-related protein 1-like [Condylostylus longicornis]